MLIPPTTKTRTLQGISDLTLVAPVRKGFVEGLDARTYATRLRLLLKTLQAGRVNQREVNTPRLFSDAVDRIREIRSFRIALFEADEGTRLLLAVTFSSPWEPYIRKVWHPLGPLLDVILCNCEGYVTAWDHSFDTYAHWIRSVQVPTEQFYSAGPTTVDDFRYLAGIEDLQRAGELASEERIADFIVISPAAAAAAAIAAARKAGQLAVYYRQAFSSLLGLHALAEMYRPGTPDGDLLLRATRALLLEFPQEKPTDPLLELLAKRHAIPLGWFRSSIAEVPPAPALPASFDQRADVQGGILDGYADVCEGCLVLLAFDDIQKAGIWLGALPVTPGTTTHLGAHPSVNIAFTREGLRQLGVPTAPLDRVSPAFREGMEARASALGDLRFNHPTQWRLPARHGATAGAPPTVQLSSVHAVLQLRTSVPAAPPGAGGAPVLHPGLQAEVDRLAHSGCGVQVLAVQPMRRHPKYVGKDLSAGHFGFLDGVSQPVVPPPGPPASDIASPAAPSYGGAAPPWSDDVAAGDILLGHVNSRRDPPALDGPWRNGSFLVVRKLRQRPAVLDAVVARAAGPSPKPSREQIRTAMMGRDDAGHSPAAASTTGTPGNGFGYAGDPAGRKCPIHSHVRRMNPRTVDDPIVPRIMRRGMSYGRFVHEDGATADEERGLVFMAYNASIEEQFEVLQHWAAGGNSSSGHSMQRDPFLGVPEPEEQPVYRFVDTAGRVQRVALTLPAAGAGGPGPIVQLEWGGYFFAPSISSLKAWAVAAAASSGGPRRATWSADEGAAIIANLRRGEAAGLPDMADRWKIALEDFSARMGGVSANVWAAIRERLGGAIRTPYGVLVADKGLIEQVLADKTGRYSVCGYQDRLRRSFGDIYLGLDEGPAYHAQADAINAAILSIDQRQAFDLTKAQATLALGPLGGMVAASRWEASFDVRELTDLTLAALCDHWFGLPDGREVAAGGFSWDVSSPPRCPGHFGAPSRYTFQPRPGETVREIGQAHGIALRSAVGRKVAAWRNLPPTAVLTRAVLAACPDDDLAARTLIGTMMGLLPTVDGGLRSTLFEWTQDRSLWDLDVLWKQRQRGPSDHDDARRLLWPPLLRTLQWRPVPELIWRTATAAGRIGTLDIQRDDRIVLGLVSAMQQDLDANRSDEYLMFGGDRRQPIAPTHACPGVDMARGVMLGLLAAVMDAGELLPTPSPTMLTVRRDGPPA